MNSNVFRSVHHSVTADWTLHKIVTMYEYHLKDLTNFLEIKKNFRNNYNRGISCVRIS